MDFRLIYLAVIYILAKESILGDFLTKEAIVLSSSSKQNFQKEKHLKKNFLKRSSITDKSKMDP